MSKLNTFFSHKKIRILFTLLLFVWIGITAYLGYNYWQNMQKHDKSNDKLKQQLAKHINLDGQLAIATVTDSTKLKQTDPFYKRAENGDKIIIWEDKAILYRESIDKIIDFGIVLREQPQKNKKAKIIILNGTQQPGLATTIKNLLTKDNSTNNMIEAISIGDAEDKSYSKTLIIDRSGGGLKSLASHLTNLLSADKPTEILPDAEKQINQGDIVIILGADQIKPTVSTEP